MPSFVSQSTAEQKKHAKKPPEKKQDAKTPDTAMVVVFENEKISKVYRVTDARQFAALEAFFPSYRNPPEAERAHAWLPDYEIYFNFCDGDTFRVQAAFDRKPSIWRIFGRGDHELKGDFRKFVAGLK